MSAIKTPRRRFALRLAAAGALAAIPLAVVALPANAATPDDNAPVVAQQIDDHGWDHHDRDRHRHDHDGWNGNGDNGGWDNNTPAPAPWLPSTGSFGS